jgi:hypothetical protein
MFTDVPKKPLKPLKSRLQGLFSWWQQDTTYPDVYRCLQCNCH